MANRAAAAPAAPTRPFATPTRPAAFELAAAELADAELEAVLVEDELVERVRPDEVAEGVDEAEPGAAAPSI